MFSLQYKIMLQLFSVILLVLRRIEEFVSKVECIVINEHRMRFISFYKLLTAR